MKLAALLLAAAFAVGAVAGCGGGGPTPRAIRVADVKRAFAEAGLRLRTVHHVVPVGPPPFRERSEAYLTWGPGTEVTVFRSARYAAQVAKQISSQIPNNVRLKRISNALFTWVVPETPALRAAIRHLS